MKCIFIVAFCFLCSFPFISQVQDKKLNSLVPEKFIKNKNRNFGVRDFQQRINSKNPTKLNGLIPIPLELKEITYDVSLVLMSEQIWYNDYWAGSWSKYKETYNGYGIDLGLNAAYGYGSINFLMSLDLGLANYYFLDAYGSRMPNGNRKGFALCNRRNWIKFRCTSRWRHTF